MLFTKIDYLNSDFEPCTGFVATEGSQIAYVGPGDPRLLPDAPSYGQEYDGRGRLLVPGLVNAHTHAPMTLLRGYAENLSLHRWLNERVLPFEAKMTDDEAHPATVLAIAEMLRFGTVSFTDMYYFDMARIRAIEETGIKANLCSGLVCFDESTYDELPNKAINEALVREWHGAFDGRLRIDLNIHAEYTTTPRVVEALGQAAARMGVRTHIHLSETRSEHEECKQRHKGMTPTAYFESLGFFEAPCTAAHGVHTEPGDWETLARRGVTVACCPASNLKLASGFAPVPLMLDAGVNVALGTDGAASNNSHNLFRELYLLALVNKGAQGDPTLVSPRQALAAATVNGARSQGRGDCGSIEIGARADLAVLKSDVPWMCPVHDVLNNVVYAAQGSDVVLTMVDGKVLYQDGIWPTIDVERALREVQSAATVIRGRL
ncbi:MAG: amidohydrolase [Coriobacteriales bacterium]|jgi:5-methylthioadenosine/S-adenosylhomocysteine deaminase|nr:amidohydrolase [Coriobacteriales bacterium]